MREHRHSSMKLPEELKVSDMINSLPTECHLLIMFANSFGPRSGQFVGPVILLPARPASRTHVFSKGRTV